jgi:hypothetical protein
MCRRADEAESSPFPHLRLADHGDPRADKPVPRPRKRLDVEQARQFLAELPNRAAGADLPAAMSADSS